MVIWLIPVLFLIICVSAVALTHRRQSMADVCKRLRNLAGCALSFSAFCVLGVILLSSTLSYASEYFKNVLSVEFMAEVREMLRGLFGTGSVFTSLQMLGACSLFLCTFSVCAFCVCGACILLMRITSQTHGSVAQLKEECVESSGGVCVRRFALLSKYLI